MQNIIEKWFGERKNATLYAILIASLLFGLGHIFGAIGQPIITVIAKTVSSLWLWESFTHCQEIQDPNGWHYIKDFICDTECIMFFNETDDNQMLIFENGNDLDLALAETYGYEFYITNRETSYLICFNHHDILCGCGNAERWIF